MGIFSSSLSYKDDMVLMRTLNMQFDGYSRRTTEIDTSSDELLNRLSNSLKQQATRVMDDNYRNLQKRLAQPVCHCSPKAFAKAGTCAWLADAYMDYTGRFIWIYSS